MEISQSMRRRQAAVIDGELKGVPPWMEPLRLDQVARQRWNLLRGDLPLPAAVIRESALQRNSEWMRQFLRFSGALLCPHGKTTMSPQLFERQLRDGAWGITISTVQQLRVTRRHGFKRILMANQLVGRREIEYVVNELAEDSTFDFFCLVDSLEGVARLVEGAATRRAGRPLQVLVEGGHAGGRTGCRTLEQALRVARAVKQAEPLLTLCGVEGYEGTLQSPTGRKTTERVRIFARFLTTIAAACAKENLFGPGPILLSAGGSAFYDVIAEALGAISLRNRYEIILRSGCYLTHDSGMYQRLNDALRKRLPRLADFGPPPAPALEIWAYVQSIPESTLAILTAGRRDCGCDAGLPLPIKRFRPNEGRTPIRLDADFQLTKLNDQHAYMRTPSAGSVKVGDMIALSISHPCTTFDKWRILFMVDDQYQVLSAVETFF